MQSSWSSLGRTFAYVHAIGYVVASILFVLLAFRITTPAAPAAGPISASSAAAIQAFQQATWPQLLASNLIFVIAFFALIPIAATLREVLGGDARAQLVSASIQTGAVLGIVGSLLTLSARSAALRQTDPTAIVAATTADAVTGTAAWVVVGLLFFVGAGIFLAGRLGLERATLPRGLAQLSLVIGAVYWFGTAVNVLASISDPTLAATLTTVWQLTVLVGGAILAPVWAVWLARTLSPRTATVRAPTRA